MNLAVVIPTLAGGGMEAMRVNLLRQWGQGDIRIDLVMSRFEGPLRDRVPKTVRIFEVSPHSPLLFPLGLRKYLLRERPTHILAAPNDVSAITLALVRHLKFPTPVVISVHNHLSSQLTIAKGVNKAKANLVVWVLRRFISHAQAVVAVSRGVADDLQSHFQISGERLHVIYNPVITADTHSRLREPLTTCPVPTGVPWILFVGRLVRAKGIDTLLSAFRNVAISRDAHLVLVGEGPLRPRAESIVKEAHLEDRVHFVGFQENPLPWMREANALVLPSRHEGLPNVLIEAMACGTQVVATDCPSGPREILENGRYGQLVPVDAPTALTDALLRVLDGTAHVPSYLLRARAGEFTVERAASRYYALLTQGSSEH